MESLSSSLLEEFQEDESTKRRESKEPPLTRNRKRMRNSNASVSMDSSEESLGVNATNEQRLRARLRKAYSELEETKRKFHESEVKLRKKVEVRFCNGMHRIRYFVDYWEILVLVVCAALGRASPEIFFQRRRD